MKVGLIDVDGHNFPNLPLMKISAYHKLHDDVVKWYDVANGYYDRIYMSKVFTFSQDYEYPLHSDDVRRGGTGYFYPAGGKQLPDEIEKLYPDYDLYGIKDTAYGFLTRGCPRGCEFCVVGKKEGRQSVKVADLSDFWHGQKFIKLLDPNLLACRECKNLLYSLEESGAYIDFTQGLDARLLTEDIICMISKLRIKMIHFAWDDYSHGTVIVPKLIRFAELTGWERHRVSVYILTNFRSTFKEDLERIYRIREIGFSPFVMIYNKETLPQKHPLRRLQRWCNNHIFFNTVKKFEDFKD